MWAMTKNKCSSEKKSLSVALQQNAFVNPTTIFKKRSTWMCWNSHVLFHVCTWNVCCFCCWSCVTCGPGGSVDAAKLLANWGPGTAWSLLQPANAFSQPPPPLLVCLSCSSSLSLCLPFFPRLSFFFFSMSYCSLHLPTPLPPLKC